MLSDKLKTLRTSRKFTQTELARRLKVTQQAIAKWEAASSLPEPGTIARLAELFEVSTDYLLGVTDSLIPPGSFAGVGIIGTVKAGYDSEAFEEYLGTAPAEVKNPEEYRYLVVRGDSMAPYIREGDMALVRLQSTLNNGDLGVVIYDGEAATLKRYSTSDGAVILEPFNPEYETVALRGPELERLIIFGRVVETHTKW